MGLSRFLKYARLESVESRSGHPFDMPVVSWLSQKRELAFPAGATFLVGENGSGKSTLVEAIAVAAGFNPEGGSTGLAFSTRASHSPLHEAIRLVRGADRPTTGFFLRAESLFHVATEVDELGKEGGLPLIEYYG